MRLYRTTVKGFIGDRIQNLDRILSGHFSLLVSTTLDRSSIKGNSLFVNASLLNTDVKITEDGIRFMTSPEEGMSLETGVDMVMAENFRVLAHYLYSLPKDMSFESNRHFTVYGLLESSRVVSLLLKNYPSVSRYLGPQFLLLNGFDSGAPLSKELLAKRFLAMFGAPWFVKENPQFLLKLYSCLSKSFSKDWIKEVVLLITKYQTLNPYAPDGPEKLLSISSSVEDLLVKESIRIGERGDSMVGKAVNSKSFDVIEDALEDLVNDYDNIQQTVEAVATPVSSSSASVLEDLSEDTEPMEPMELDVDPFTMDSLDPKYLEEIYDAQIETVQENADLLDLIAQKVEHGVEDVGSVDVVEPTEVSRKMMGELRGKVCMRFPELGYKVSPSGRKVSIKKYVNCLHSGTSNFFYKKSYGTSIERKLKMYITFLVDVSGSMSQDTYGVEKTYGKNVSNVQYAADMALALTDALLAEGHYVRIVTFSSSFVVTKDWHDPRPSALHNMSSGTYIKEPLENIVSSYEDHKSEMADSGKLLLIFTDGEISESREVLDPIMVFLKSLSVSVYNMYIGRGEQSRLGTGYFLKDILSMFSAVKSILHSYRTKRLREVGLL